MTATRIAREPQSHRGYVDVDGAQVHYRERGHGRPLVFLHQTASSSIMWERVFRRFADGYRLIAFDTPGFGSSDPPAQPASVSGYAARLRAAARALGVERPLLVGHHTGACIATEWAASDTDVSGLVLLGAVVVSDDLEEQRQRKLTIKGWDIDSRGDWVVDVLVPRMRQSVTRDDPVHMELELTAYVQAGSGYVDAYQSVWAYRAAERLPLITAPTLCAVGADEGRDLQRWTELAATLVRDGEFRLLAAAGSQMTFEEPDRVANLIVEFAAERCPAS